ncbi:MAG: hypothetical protein C4297_11185 [Gemmataceae bacterium]
MKSHPVSVILALGTWIGVGMAALPGCGNGVSSGVVPTNSESGTPAPRQKEPIYFTDVTATSGLRHIYRNGEEADHYAILESLGGGVGLIDYDRDGLLDILVPGGGYFDAGPSIRGYPTRLFRNLGGFRFRDVTEEAGLPTQGHLFYNHGVAVADYDNDGWPDFLLTGYGRLALYRNEHGRFLDVTEKAGLRDQRPLHWSTSAAWADFDGDGWLDLYVCHYVDWSFRNHPRCGGYRVGQPVDVCPPKLFQPLQHALYLNNGDGTFREVTVSAGIKPGKGLGVIACDLDNDGRIDIYVANDTTDNYLYLNQGRGQFREVAAERGVATDDQGIPNGSMGLDVAAYDGSEAPSIFVTNYQNEAHALYRNLGNGQFRFVSRSAGIAAIGLVYVGFGTGFIDIDHDGAEDLLISNGHAVRYPQPPSTLRQRPVLLWNRRRPGQAPATVFFEEITPHGGSYFAQEHIGRGVALGDLDNDGATDVVISHLNEPVAILRGEACRFGNWLGIHLVGRPQPDAIGAKLTLEVAGHKLVRFVKGGGSYLSSNDTRIVFGLGSAEVSGPLTVRWPSGRVQTWKALAANRYWILREGEADAQMAPYSRQGLPVAAGP